MTAALALLATLSFIGVGAIVGMRMLFLAARTRQAPELLVGGALFLIAGVGYPALIALNQVDISLSTARPLAVSGTLALAIGWIFVLWFTQRVFRSSSPAARWGCLAIGAGLTALTGLELASVLRAREVAELRGLDGWILWIEQVAVGIYLWTAIEGFLEYGRARRRVALGLGEPLVANRFLLWGWVGLASLASSSLGIVMARLGRAQAEDALLQIITGLVGLFCSAALSLAFMPPAGYRRWIAARAARAAA